MHLHDDDAVVLHWSFNEFVSNNGVVTPDPAWYAELQYAVALPRLCHPNIIAVLGATARCWTIPS